MAATDYSRFLAEAGWEDATVAQMGADMGLRRYCDLQKPDGARALLMDMSNAGYEESLGTFVSIANYLNENNIKAPDILHSDFDEGLSVIEHFGSTSFGDALHGGEDKNRIYDIATDVLYKMRQNLTQNGLDLGGYKQARVWERLEQFVDFYMPVAAAVEPTEDAHKDLWTAMAEIEGHLPEPLSGFCHADYHLENLMWCPDRADGYGLIDFQDAFWGPLVYDLLNLLEDARVTVPEDIKKSAKEKYCQGMSDAERASFDAWYTYLSMHFHCRVIGLFVKFSKENNSTDFLVNIPRLQNYIKGHLKNPVMASMKNFMEKYQVSLDVDLSGLLKTG